MSFFRHLAACLACRWGAVPRSDKVRVGVFAVSVPLAALTAWHSAPPADPLGASMLPIAGARVHAVEPPSQRERPDSLGREFDEEAAGRSGEWLGGPGAKVTIESESTAGGLGAQPGVEGQHDDRSKTFTVREKSSSDAEPLFRQDGARGESSGL